MSMRKKEENPFAERLRSFADALRRRDVSAAIVRDEANLKGLIGFGCDNGWLVVQADGPAVFYTDFRYIPAARREAPWVQVRDARRLRQELTGRLPRGAFRLGYEGGIRASEYISLGRVFRRAALVDVGERLLRLRAVKTPSEIARLAAAEALNDRIWRESSMEFRRGMTEKDMQRIIRARMNALGDGEAFETIVCVGGNAAECHHVPDETVWDGRAPLLVDMGVRLDGYCSDMTRCVRPHPKWELAGKYGEVYDLVLKANLAAIAQARPGITGRELDAAARSTIRKAGHGRRFGHALGHGVGLEIHERPVASSKSKDVLRPGMLVTVEPGVYIEGEFGIRIEDLVLITRDGCEVLSSSPK